MRECLGEFIGTFTLIFIGTSVATLQGFLSGYGDTGESRLPSVVP